LEGLIEFSLEIYGLLIAVGFISGFINAIAGGGGLLVLPVMLWLGVPPINALATGKFQAVFGTLSSSFNYFRRGFIDFKPLLPVIICGVLASALGTYSVLQLSSELLDSLIPYFLIGVALFTWFSPRLSDEDHSPLISYRHFIPLAGGLIGFYGGFFGPGIGAIAALCFSSVLGYNLRKASANAKPVIVSVNIVSVVIFVLAGEVYLLVGLAMAGAQIGGAYLGVNVAIKRGAKVIKPLLVLTTIAIAIRLLLS